MHRSWKEELAQILKDHNPFGTPHKKGIRERVGSRTEDKRHQVLYMGFTQLRALGYRLSSVRSFREKHMKALVTVWDKEGLAPATIQNRISIFRTFSGWIGKAGMITEATHYVEDPNRVKRSYKATVDKSWSAKGVDPLERIQEIELFDKHVAVQLRVICAFGLRVQEGVRFQPHRADKGAEIEVIHGTKGGKQRTVPIQTPEQRKILDEAKTFVGYHAPNRSLASRYLNLAQAIHRFYYTMKRFGITIAQLGVTPHGLRHEYANDRFEDEAGVPSPVRGGDSREISGVSDVLARTRVSAELGHVRTSITSAYLGTKVRRRTPATN